MHGVICLAVDVLKPADVSGMFLDKGLFDSLYVQGLDRHIGIQSARAHKL
jgi:hypothetical protein